MTYDKASKRANEYQRIAAELNAKIAAGGFVQVSTYCRATVYKFGAPFTAEADGLYVQHGKRKDFIMGATGFLVSVRTGTFNTRS